MKDGDCWHEWRRREVAARNTRPVDDELTGIYKKFTEI